MPIYSDIYSGPPRSYTGRATKHGITVHSTENTSASARDEANYAKNRTDGTSSHYYVDGREIIQSLNTDYGANHAGSWWPNQRCISYEFCGTVRWSRSTWLASIDWDAAAAAIARDCQRWGIPADWLTVGELADKRGGFNTHDDCRRAFGGTSHTDPGPNFPKDHLLSLVTEILNGDDMQLSDQMNIPEWIRNSWPGIGGGDDKISVATCLVSGYGHSRTANDNVKAVMAEQQAAKLRDEAILAAVEGLDSAAIIAKIDAHAAAEAQRDADLVALVDELRDIAAGGATADAIVDKVAERLAS